MSSTALTNSLPSSLPSKPRWQAIIQATVLENRWIPKHPLRPSLKQSIFLACEAEEAFYGGAAAGGKSEALLMAALLYIEIPGYAAIIFRKTYADLALPGALMDRAHEWLGGTAARWSDKEKTWHFPSGATLTFGYLDNVRDHFRYQGSQFDYCAFDELSQFPENQYRYLFSRLLPLQFRFSSRPRREINGVLIPIMAARATAWTRRIAGPRPRELTRGGGRSLPDRPATRCDLGSLSWATVAVPSPFSPSSFTSDP
jgi:hypothetical protein